MVVLRVYSTYKNVPSWLIDFENEANKNIHACLKVSFLYLSFQF